MNISKSIFTLTKYNNGFFKSEKQAAFLIDQMEKADGCIGVANSGYNQCPIFAEWDNKGITKVVKHNKKHTVMFERKTPGILTEPEKKEIKRLERKAKSINKDIKEFEQSFRDGSYNKTGDVSTYTADMIERYEAGQQKRRDQVSNLEDKINQIKNQ